MSVRDDDIAAIRAVIARQFAAMSWQTGGGPDWKSFRADYRPEAQLFPSARPLAVQTLDAFVGRMQGLAGSALGSFEETVLGSKIEIFGNVAIAAVACENKENGRDRNRVIEMMLLVKDAGEWKIAAQAWDKESPGNPIPSELVLPDKR